MAASDHVIASKTPRSDLHLGIIGLAITLGVLALGIVATIHYLSKTEGASLRNLKWQAVARTLPPCGTVPCVECAS